jgi:hypothetical protein
LVNSVAREVTFALETAQAAIFDFLARVGRIMEQVGPAFQSLDLLKGGIKAVYFSLNNLFPEF